MYEWDATKRQENLSKHGLSFDDAETVFSGPCVTFEDTRFDYGEPRFITIGRLEGHVVVVAHTPRRKNTRIIAMRKGIAVKKKPTKSNLKRLDTMSDVSIDYSDIPALDAAFFRDARVVVPPGKKQLTVRLDADVLEWLRGQGKGYQSRINAILRAYYEAHQ